MYSWFRMQKLVGKKLWERISESTCIPPGPGYLQEQEQSQRSNRDGTSHRHGGCQLLLWDRHPQETLLQDRDCVSWEQHTESLGWAFISRDSTSLSSGTQSTWLLNNFTLSHHRKTGLRA